jgi:hypothetical protein
VNTVQLNRLAKRVHAQNVKAGWWSDLKTGKRIERDLGELLMLVITELAEAVEGIRKDLMDDKLPHRKMEEVELGDAAIRLLDISGGFGIPFSPHVTLDPKHIQKNKLGAILAISQMVSSAKFSMLPVSTCLTTAMMGIIRYCDHHNLDLWGAVEEKLKYNQKREDHKPENRRKANGKKL